MNRIVVQIVFERSDLLDRIRAFLEKAAAL